jgi:hypothetical protein
MTAPAVFDQREYDGVVPYERTGRRQSKPKTSVTPP